MKTMKKAADKPVNGPTIRTDEFYRSNLETTVSLLSRKSAYLADQPCEVNDSQKTKHFPR
jgi:hypothetical protein